MGRGLYFSVWMKPLPQLVKVCHFLTGCWLFLGIGCQDGVSVPWKLFSSIPLSLFSLIFSSCKVAGRLEGTPSRRFSSKYRRLSIFRPWNKQTGQNENYSDANVWVYNEGSTDPKTLSMSWWLLHSNMFDLWPTNWWLQRQLRVSSGLNQLVLLWRLWDQSQQRWACSSLGWSIPGWESHWMLLLGCCWCCFLMVGIDLVHLNDFINLNDRLILKLFNFFNF